MLEAGSLSLIALQTSISMDIVEGLQPNAPSNAESLGVEGRLVESTNKCGLLRPNRELRTMRSIPNPSEARLKSSNQAYVRIGPSA